MQEADEVIYRRFLACRREEDLRLLFDRYKEHLMLFLQSLVGNGEDAEDLMMDTFAAVAAGSAVFNGRSSFKTWLFAIAKKQAGTLMRRRSRRKLGGVSGRYSAGGRPGIYDPAEGGKPEAV